MTSFEILFTILAYFLNFGACLLMPTPSIKLLPTPKRASKLHLRAFLLEMGEQGRKLHLWRCFSAIRQGTACYLEVHEEWFHYSVGLLSNKRLFTQHTLFLPTLNPPLSALRTKQLLARLALHRLADDAQAESALEGVCLPFISCCCLDLGEVVSFLLWGWF